MKYLKFATAALFAFTLPLSAHSLLDSADPADGAQLSAPPAAITLTFTETLEPALNTLVVKDATGTALALGTLRYDSKTGVLGADLPVLAPGQYRVEWSVTSVDTHSTSGAYDFTVE